MRQHKCYMVSCFAFYLVFFGMVRGYAAPLQDESRDAVVQKILDSRDSTTRQALLRDELNKLQSDQFLAIMKDAFEKIPDANFRLTLLQNFQDHPYIHELLHIAILDKSLTIQNYALRTASLYGLQDFNNDYKAYLRWRKNTEGKTLSEAIAYAATEFQKRILTLKDNERQQAIQLVHEATYSITAFNNGNTWRKTLGDAGVTTQLASMLRDQNNAGTIYSLLVNLRPSDAVLRQYVLPLLASTEAPAVRTQAFILLARSGSWATDRLVEVFLEDYPSQFADSVGYHLVSLGDPKLIPILIGTMESDNTPEGNNYMNNLLYQITGVRRRGEMSAADWKVWWQNNAERFSPNVRNMPIPKFNFPPRQARNVSGDPVNRAIQVRIDDDIKRTYWVILTPNTPRLQVIKRIGGNLDAPPPPPIQPAREPLGVLVVLTRDGRPSGAVQDWLRLSSNLFQNKFLVVMPEATRWSNEQKEVWIPKAKMATVKDAKFATEEFLEEIIKDVSGKYLVNPKKIILLGQVESGAMAYTAALATKSPFSGFCIFNSPFKSTELPPLKNAKGRSFLLQYSDASTVPLIMVAAAQKVLTENGAKVEVKQGKRDTADAIYAELFSWIQAQK